MLKPYQDLPHLASLHIDANSLRLALDVPLLSQLKLFHSKLQKVLYEQRSGDFIYRLEGSIWKKQRVESFSRWDAIQGVYGHYDA